MELYAEHMLTLRPLFNMLEYNVHHNKSWVEAPQAHRNPTVID